MTSVRRHLVALVLVWLLALTGVAGACPMCSEALPSDPSAAAGDAAAASLAGPQLAEGFYYAILLMMGMVFAVPAGLAGLLYAAVRQQQRTAAGPTQPVSGKPHA